jgi:hypothetical protein
MHYLVYKITNIINEKFYIGCHRTSNKDDGYLGSGTLLRRAIAKYGAENFKKEILFEAESAEAMFAKEAELVIVGQLSYNLKRGGEGGFDLINKSGKKPWNREFSHSERSRGGLAHTGKRKSNDHRKKISMTLVGNTRSLGYQHTQETKERMRLASLAREKKKREEKLLGPKC